MKRVNIYIGINPASTRKSKKRYGFVLECIINDFPHTREWFEEVEDTYNGATLKVINAAILRMRCPCEIHLYVENTYILNMIDNNLDLWSKNGFQNSKGNPLENQEEWRKLWQQSTKHYLVPEPGRHKVEAKPEVEIQAEKKKTKEETEPATNCNQVNIEDDQVPGQTELTKDFPQYCPSEMIESSSESKLEAEIEVPAEECINRPYQTRREYMEQLSEEDLKIYMTKAMGEMFRTRLRKASIQVFTTVCFWGDFFSDEVDENGKTIMEA